MKQIEKNQPGLPADTSEANSQQFTEDEKKACSIQAMLNGEECEACQ
jgi:hypothetical protein